MAAASMVAAGVPGTFLVDTFPICKFLRLNLLSRGYYMSVKYVPAWMPGAGFQRKARAWKVAATDMIVRPFDFVKRGMVSTPLFSHQNSVTIHAQRNFEADGTAAPSILASLLERISARSGVPPDEEEVIRNAVGIAYLAGADTVRLCSSHISNLLNARQTVSALSTFIIAMVLHPDVQRKAQDELDSVIGMDRLPNFQDREHLPYISALCKELLRWRPVLPLGVAHCASEDDIYGEFFIPKGSVVIGNSWYIFPSSRR